MSKLRGQHLYKVFGADPQNALELLNSGMSKDEILEQTGHVIAVNNASFEVDEGEIFVIMGLSGSGKSTLLRLINRLIDPTAGTMEINGEDIAHASDKRLREIRMHNTSMVFQRFALFPHRTVLENAAFGLEIQGVGQSERVERAREALGMVGLTGWETSYPDHLSGGMQQRVGLARALATDADILLMDEPFSALDPLIRREVQDQLIDLQQQLKKTIVFVTHDLNEAMRLGDQIAVMRDGLIVQTGSAVEILNEPATDYVAAFIQDVDRNRVITVGSIMEDSLSTISPDAKPAEALQQMEAAGVSELIVINGRNDDIVGMVQDQDVAAIHAQKGTSVESAIQEEYPQAGPDMPIADVFGIAASSPLPIVVVDDASKVLGVVTRDALLSAAERNTSSNGA